MKIERHLLMTGIPLIDRQHEQLADLVDRLSELAAHGNVSRQTLSTEASAVLKYAMEHFDAEESLMRMQEYPGYEEHRSKHNVFRGRTDVLTSDLEGDVNPDEYTIKLSKWIIEWFYEHVLAEDRKLAAFLKKTTNWQSLDQQNAGDRK